ncbi:MAG: hypothetical protein L6406_22050 [Desulfobacterales bacterium]|nr:hypothetical protein [Desulfobacterales bacterium]
MVRICRSETVNPLMARLVGVFILFGILSCTAVDSDVRGAAPQPLFNVGYQVLDLKYRKDGQEQTLTVAVWYPTPAQPKSHNCGGPTSGNFAVDAAPSAEGGPYPFLVFSHGYGGGGLSAVFLTEGLAAELHVCARNIGKEHHGYSETHNVLHVVHNHKWRHLDSVDSVLRVRPGFSVSHAKQMVSHSPRNLQRGHLLVPRVVQNLLSGLQCRSLRRPADHRIRRSIQQEEHPGVVLKIAPDAPRGPSKQE